MSLAQRIYVEFLAGPPNDVPRPGGFLQRGMSTSNGQQNSIVWARFLAPNNVEDGRRWMSLLSTAAFAGIALGPET